MRLQSANRNPQWLAALLLLALPLAARAETPPRIEEPVRFGSVGSRLPGLTRTLLELDQAQAKDQEQPEGEESSRTAAFIDSVALMPDRWFGYTAADVVVLATGSKAFVGQLLQ